MERVAYRIILEPEVDGSAYNAIIPAFPHAHTYGATIEEAMVNAREVIKLALDIARERDDAVPPGDADDDIITTVTVSE